VRVQLRTAPDTNFSSPHNTWYGPGVTANAEFVTTATTAEAACTRTGAGATKTVTCLVDPASPLNASGKGYVQYKVTIEGLAAEALTVVDDVQVVYAVNSPPTVSSVTASQGADGAVTVSYSVSDPDNSSFTVGLFYDVGLRLPSSSGAADATISVDAQGLDLSALVPPEGVLLLDNEQVKYFRVSGNSFVTNTLTGKPIVRGAYNTLPASHAAGATVWVRATDGQVANDFSRTAAASGHVGSNVAAGTGRGIQWRPAQDIPGSIYLTGQNLRVVANDGEAVKQVGGATIATDFTLDTKPPQLPSNALDVTGTGVQTTSTGFKTMDAAVTLTLTGLDASNDNPAGNRLAVCNGAACGTPTAGELIAGTPGWSALAAYTATRSATLDSSNQTSPQQVRVAVVDPAGNVTVRSKSIVLDATAPPRPQNFTVQDASSDKVGGLVYMRWDQLPPFQDGYGANDFARFRIFRDNLACASPTNGFCELTSFSGVTITSYADASVVAGTTYRYRVITEDNIGNTSDTLADALATFPSTTANGSAGVTGTAQAPPTPVISNVRVTAVTETTATVTWDTDVASDSRVAYAATASPPPDFAGYPTQGVACAAGGTGCATSGADGHAVTLRGLDPSTRYYLEARSAAPGGPTATKSQEGGTPFSLTTLTPPPVVKPVISNPSVTVTHSTATFTWTTDLDSDSFVEYGTSSQLGITAATYGQRDSTRSHTVVVGNLTPATTYYYRLNSTAGQGTGVHPTPPAAPLSLTTLQDPSDATPPQYSNVQVTNVQHNTATVTWTTNEPATEFVEFWKDGDSARRIWPPTPGSLKTSHSVQLPLDLTPETTYRFVVISYDASNNGLPSSEQPPFTTLPDPGNIPAPTITGLRHDPPTATSVAIYFATDVPADASVIYSADGGPDSIQYFPTLTLDHAVTLLNLTPGKTYTFKVRAANANGLSSEAATCAGAPCTFATPTSNSPLPEIVAGSISVTDVGPFQATVRWRTTQPGNSMVEFGTAVSTGGLPIYGRSFGSVKENVTDHAVALPSDLLSGETYYFRVRTRDAYEQLVVYPATPDPTDSTCAADRYNCRNPSFTTTASDLIQVAEKKSPPIITGVGALLVTDVKVVVGWTTDKPADSEVFLGTSTTYCSPDQPPAWGCPKLDAPPPKGTNANALTRAHSLTVEGLTPTTTYYFKVASTDGLDQRAEDDRGGLGYSFTTTAGTEAVSQEEYDQLQQQIADLQSQIAQVEGQLQDPNLSDGDRAALQAELDRLKAELARLQGVIPQTDAVPPVITEVQVSNVTDTTADVTWNTDEPATSIVQYGETAAYGALAGDSTSRLTGHTVKLTRLAPGTDYHYRVVSYDAAGNRAESTDATFTTKGVKGTETPAEEQEPGEGKEKDKKGKDELDEATKRIQSLSADKKLSVERILDLLRDFTEDEVGQILSSVGVQLVSPPEFVGGAPRVEVTTNSATITWRTNRESDSRVAYAAETSYAPSRDEPYQTETGDTSRFVIEHEVTLLNLGPNTRYHFQVRSRERAGRTARAADRTFTTLPLKPEVTGLAVAEVTERTATLTWKTNVPTKTVVDYTERATKATRSQGDPQLVTAHRFTLTGLAPDTAYEAVVRAEDEGGLATAAKPLTFATGRDEQPPEVAKVRTDVTLSPGKSEFAQAIVTWTTDEPATSQVLYEEGITQSPELKNASPENAEHLVNHVVVLNRLRPATVYRFRVISTDPAGNRAESRDYTLLTPQKKETVLEIIIKNFEETFGFLKAIGR
jgi:uncharacterized small protein (DUF1192 family)